MIALKTGGESYYVINYNQHEDIIRPQLLAFVGHDLGGFDTVCHMNLLSFMAQLRKGVFLSLTTPN
jgi:hypothetical protein